eukprot:scaffold19_cov286-Prasinococcus_capsulatus_cf.AAC.3
MSVVRLCMSESSAACTSASDSASSAEVASSSSMQGGSLITARAMAMRCFWPPLSCAPRSPTGVSYPPGSPVMKLCALAARAAASICACVASGLP